MKKYYITYKIITLKGTHFSQVPQNLRQGRETGMQKMSISERFAWMSNVDCYLISKGFCL